MHIVVCDEFVQQYGSKTNQQDSDVNVEKDTNENRYADLYTHRRMH